MSNLIHPTAFVSTKAKLGENVYVGPCALIEDDTEIGDDCRIDAFASVKRYTKMGKGNIIHSHAMVGGEPQDLKFAGEVSWLELGNKNTIREFATLHRGTAAGGGVTKIGDSNLLMAYTHVAHDCQLGNGIVMSNAATLAGHVSIGNYAIIGGLSAVHQFCRIGDHAFLGGMSGIGQDLPPYMLASGSRATVHGPNSIGLRRSNLSAPVIASIKSAYRLYWLSGIPRPEALAQIEATYGEHPELMAFVAFIKESTRGVVAATKESTEKEDA